MKAKCHWGQCKGSHPKKNSRPAQSATACSCPGPCPGGAPDPTWVARTEASLRLCQCMAAASPVADWEQACTTDPPLAITSHSPGHMYSCADTLAEAHQHRGRCCMRIAMRGMCADTGTHVYRNVRRCKQQAQGQPNRRADFINWACKYEQKGACSSLASP